MRKFVIDTSIFVNPEIRKQFGKTTESSIRNFIKLIKNKKEVEVYMPPSILEELKNFTPEAENFEGVVKKRSPNMFAIYLPAAVFYDFIEEVRLRINKGLRLAEKFAVENLNKKEKISKLRDKYRDAMRSGILDSKEDFELILLAKELDATIVSADEGIVKFSHKMGCETLDAKKLKKVLEDI